MNPDRVVSLPIDTPCFYAVNIMHKNNKSLQIIANVRLVTCQGWKRPSGFRKTMPDRHGNLLSFVQVAKNGAIFNRSMEIFKNFCVCNKKQRKNNSLQLPLPDSNDHHFEKSDFSDWPHITY